MIHGVCWLDLGTPDPASAAEFYGELLGWQVGDADSTGYRLATLDGHLVAAFGPTEDPGPPYWTVYAATADAAATCRAAQAAGGSVVAEAAPAGDAGVAATLRSPEGVPLSLWQAGQHVGTPRSGAPGTLARVDLCGGRSADEQWLAAVLGWHRREAGLVVGDEHVAGLRRQVLPGRSPWLVSFAIADVTTARSRAHALGATSDQQGTLVDPWGAHFDLVATR